MSFDWIEFLERYGVEYTTSGPNVARGHVSIKCIYCRDDPSMHLTIALSGAGWRCYRNHDHRGKSPLRLIQALARCDYDQAQKIAYGTTYIPTGFLERVRAPAIEKRIVDLKMPEEFYVIKDLPSAKPYISYLVNRGFERSRILKFTDLYGMRYCTHGSFQGRIVFPVESQKKLMSWTGRAISRHATQRYRALDVETSGVPISDFLLWYDDLLRGDASSIYLCEGPFDALKVRELGRGKGIISTCFFTRQPSIKQIDLLHEILPRYRNRFLLLDRDAISTSIRVMQQLSQLGVVIKKLPDGVKDPGELSKLNILLDCGEIL
jgi:hypothetical protein